MKSKWIVFIGTGFEVVGIILASVWLGEFLDRYFAVKGLFTLLLVFIGFGGWFSHLIFLLKKMNKS